MQRIKSKNYYEISYSLSHSVLLIFFIWFPYRSYFETFIFAQQHVCAEFCKCNRILNNGKTTRKNQCKRENHFSKILCFFHFLINLWLDWIVLLRLLSKKFLCVLCTYAEVRLHKSFWIIKIQKWNNFTNFKNEKSLQ